MHKTIAPFLALAVSGGIAAQEPKESILEEVIVTAERREASIQDTAISITAMSGDILKARGIENFADIHQHVPNFYYSEPGQAGITQIAIRGVGNENVTAAGDPGVAYHLDGVYLGRSGSALTDMWDMERVEVLRGPQGTLYGRNATGGSINVITKKPDDEFNAVADVLVGDYNRMQARFAIGGPVVEDKVKVRISGTTNKHDGYIVNNVDPDICPSCEDMGSADSQSIRAHLLFTPANNLDILLSAQQYEDDGLRSFTTLLLPGQRSRGQPDLPKFDTATPNSPDVRTIVEDFPESFHLSQDVYTAKLTWRNEALSFSSLTSFSEFQFKTLIDHDNSDLPISQQSWADDVDQWVQEFQLTTNFDGPLQGIVGLFYLEEDIHTEYFFEDVGVFTFSNGGDFTARSIAPFANLSYDFAESGSDMPLKLTGGIRWTRDTKEGDHFQMIPEFGVDISGVLDKKWTEVTWDFVAQYELSDDVMVYGSVSRGYKAGGVLVGNFPGEYNPETILAYEVGVKSQLAARYQINASAFLYDYKDLQLFLLEAPAGARIENASNADVSGIEIEALAEPIDNLSINAQFSWLDAKLKGYRTTDDIFPELGVQDFSGNRPNRAPEFSYSIGVQYRLGLGDYGSLTPRVDHYWQDDTYLRPMNLERDKQAAYHRTNARLTWLNADERWTAELFVNNIEDDDIVQNLALGGGSLGFPNNVTLYAPRMYGLRLGMQF